MQLHTICMYIIYICMIHTCKHTTYKRIHAYTHTHIRIYIHTYIQYVCIYMQLHTICMYIIYIRMIHTCKHTTYKRIHAYTHNCVYIYRCKAHHGSLRSFLDSHPHSDFGFLYLDYCCCLTVGKHRMEKSPIWDIQTIFRLGQ